MCSDWTSILIVFIICRYLSSTFRDERFSPSASVLEDHWEERGFQGLRVGLLEMFTRFAGG
jgi:hypothetical protein